MFKYKCLMYIILMRSNNNDSTSLNEIKIQLEANDQLFIVPVNINSNAEEVAFAFCKEHSINYSHLPTLTKTITSFIKKKKQTKRLFSIQEFIQRIKEKNDSKTMANTTSIAKGEMIMTKPHKSINTSRVQNRKPLRTHTIIDNNKQFDRFLSNRNNLVDNLFNQFNVTLPLRNNKNNVIHNSELFLTFEESQRLRIGKGKIANVNGGDEKRNKCNNNVMNSGYAQRYLNSSQIKLKGSHRVKTNN